MSDGALVNRKPPPLYPKKQYVDLGAKEELDRLRQPEGENLGLKNWLWI